LTVWLRAAFRMDLRAALIADLVLAMALEKVRGAKHPKSSR
jgi:hypothetical protein